MKKTAFLTLVCLLASATLALGAAVVAETEAHPTPATTPNLDLPWAFQFLYLDNFVPEGCTESWTSTSGTYCSSGLASIHCTTGTCGPNGDQPSQFTNNGSSCSCSCCSANQ